MRNIVILGSTGSIGKSALELIDGPLSGTKVIALSANENEAELSKQIKKYRPEYAVMQNPVKAERLKKRFRKTKILAGTEGLVRIASLKKADVVLLSIVGAAGIIPLMSAIRQGKKIALANKEALIIAGRIIQKEIKKYGACILPVDSEHNAVFQALKGNKKQYVKKLIITASGGPFKNTAANRLKNITVPQALDHPTWKMGRKITIDSATLMNKGLEVIEAHYLFGIPYEKIEVVIHPQSIIHSMVEYIDGSVIAQMSMPDMRLPIMYALTYPERRNGIIKPLRLEKLSKLTFFPVDFKKFRSFSLALEAGKTGGTMPAVMNAANETAVKNFLKKKIKFTDIPVYIEKAMRAHRVVKKPDFEEILKTDLETREKTEMMING
ncbi:MAG: 1-deoxy-D-xylulose-5-phosphate reductoisomerase [Candidatus Goldiibacteriota bacterium]